jgi:2-oxoglutarate dehydrogenase E2 component (dihydrolipoamide succinyltransferase)
MAVQIRVPEMGESVVDARVRRWLKKAGESVTVGEPLVELETDKVDVEVSAPKTGVLAAIAHAEGADVKIGDTLGTIDESRPSEAGSSDPASAESRVPSPESRVQSPESKEVQRSGGPEVRKSDVAATPSARRAAREHDVPLTAVQPDGPRVTKADVVKSAPKRSAPGEPVEPVEPARARETRERMSKRRATIAKRLVEVQATAAMLTTFNEVDMTAVMALRERQKQAFRDTHGVSLGFSSFFVKAAIAALREFPRLNAEIQGDEIVLKHFYDIGIAVGAAEGLVVPVLRNADTMSFAAIELGVRAFATKAKDNTLSLDDLRGGTFTITNGGVFGSLMSTPILNPPQVGILGLHAIKERPVGVNGQIVLRPMMYTALTYDHRIVDGAEAVRFLVRVKELVEDPGVLLVSL